MAVTIRELDDIGAPAAPARRYLMCPPDHFDVVYSINPWMRPARPTDRARALLQWRRIEDAYLCAGHDVNTVDPVEGLPDMVFTANAAIVIGGRVLAARFRHPERSGEEAAYLAWFGRLGFAEVVRATYANEGEGDYLAMGSMILGGSGFRTDPRSHAEVSEFFDREVVPLELIDDRFYHLDTALAVLDDRTVAYWPGAFSTHSQGVIAERFPDAVLASEEDATAFGLNACSDGDNVVMSAGAPGLADRLRERGFSPVLVDTSELQKSGGSAKCCTLELRC
ncbi:MAG: dimethylargininase [Acidimicrobiales bacterium]